MPSEDGKARPSPEHSGDIERAYAEHRRRVYEYFRRSGLREEAAEDLTQDVFATLVATLGRFDPARRVAELRAPARPRAPRG